MAKKPAAAVPPARDPDAQMLIRFTGEVRLEEWLTTYQPGQEVTVQARLLDDPRLQGKFEEI